MILTGIRNQEDRESRISDYYNNLRKRSKLNESYEEAVNAAKDRTINNITKPPPPEENLDKELNDLNLQKQKAFESIKSILKKQEESIKFLGKLDNAEIVPFNKYFAKFKNTTTGIEVKDADFLIKLWDSFKKKILLTDKETPILGTELDDYKKELKTKAENIVDYAEELGLNSARIKSALDVMVNDSDSAAIDKFYYNLLTKGPQAAAVVLKEDFKAPEEVRPVIIEEVVPEDIRADYIEQYNKLYAEREKLKPILDALILRNIILPYTEKSGPAYLQHQLDINKKGDQGIIKRQLPYFVNKLKNYTKEMNKILKLSGQELLPADDILRNYRLDDETKVLLPSLSLEVPVEIIPTIEEEEPVEMEAALEPRRMEAALEPKKPKFDFDSIPRNDVKNLMELFTADKSQVIQYIYSLHPDGKFQFNGVKYNLNRNPPTIDTMKEYLLKPFNETYRTNFSPTKLFKQLVESDIYEEIKSEMEEEEANKLAEEERKSKFKKEISEKAEKISTERLNKKEKEEFLKSLQNQAAKIAEEAFTIQKLNERKVIKPIVDETRSRLYKAAESSGLTDFKRLNDDEIASAFKGTPNETIINLMREIVEPYESDIDRIEKAAEQKEILAAQIEPLLNELEYAKGKNLTKIKNKLSTLEAEYKTAQNFLNKNEEWYTKTIEGINKFQTKLGPISEYISGLKPDDLKRSIEQTKISLEPLKERYDDIGQKLYDNGFRISSFADAIASLEVAEPTFTSPKRVVGVSKVKPEKIKTRTISGITSKAERRRKEEEDEEKRLQQYQEEVARRNADYEAQRDMDWVDEMLALFEDEKKQPAGSGTKQKKRDKLKPIQFGKYKISGKALGMGVLDIRTECNRTTAKLPRTPITSRVEKAINYVIKYNDIDQDLFDQMTQDEKKTFIYALEIAEVDLKTIPFNVFKKFSAVDANKEIDSLIDRYHILVGELSAGNNAPEILREIKGILFKLLEKKKIDRVYANEILLMINAVA